MQLIADENLLPPRQRLTLLCAARGLCVKLTAREMNTTPRAVTANRAALMHKLRAQNTPQMIAEAFKRGHLKYIPVFLLCMSAIFGGFDKARTVRRPVRTVSYSRQISRNEVSA